MKCASSFFTMSMIARHVPRGGSSGSSVSRPEKQALQDRPEFRPATALMTLTHTRRRAASFVILDTGTLSNFTIGLFHQFAPAV